MRRGYVFRPQSLLAGCTRSIGPHAVITQVLCGIMGYTQFVTVLSVKHLLLLCQIAFPFQKCMTHQPLMYFPTSSHFTFLFLETGSRPHPTPTPGFFFFFQNAGKIPLLLGTGLNSSPACRVEGEVCLFC